MKDDHLFDDADQFHCGLEDGGERSMEPLIDARWVAGILRGCNSESASVTQPSKYLEPMAHLLHRLYERCAVEIDSRLQYWVYRYRAGISRRALRGSLRVIG